MPALSCIASVAFWFIQSAFFLKQYKCTCSLPVLSAGGHECVRFSLRWHCTPAKPTHESRAFLFLAILFSAPSVTVGHACCWTVKEGTQPTHTHLPFQMIAFDVAIAIALPLLWRLKHTYDHHMQACNTSATR